MAINPGGSFGTVTVATLVKEIAPLDGARFTPVNCGFIPRNWKFSTLVENTAVLSEAKVAAREKLHSKFVPGTSGRHAQFSPTMPPSLNPPFFC